ncbi:hypothetical protein [Halomarina rubra]|uniref:Small CPxCG-related zinc finger protein n=1 Tax=Halomarina rubra TaxID=2071873 RepID=A0ABD6B051_9EURY|nr:hypothetical protein [Halomarina rubra]
MAVPLRGSFVLQSVDRRIVARGSRVADCPVCGRHLAEDDWHVAATVRSGSLAAPRESVHHLCDDDCLSDWLALMDERS